jgi:hypothetical protein
MDRRASEWERQRAKEIAAAVLDGRTTVLEAVRELYPLAHTDAIVDEEDRTIVIAIESETDDLPIGEVRKLWAPDALSEGCGDCTCRGALQSAISWSLPKDCGAIKSSQ